MFDFLRKMLRPAADVAAAPEVRGRHGPIELDPSVKSEGSQARLSFSDISGYRAVLSHGPHAVVSVPRELEHSLLVLDMPDARALALHTGATPALAQALTRVRSALLVHGREIADEREVDAGLIAQVLKAERAARAHEPRMRRTEHWALFQRLVTYAVDVRASDIHIYWHGSEGIVRYRVHGSVEVMQGPERGVFPAAALRAALSVAYQAGMGKSNTDTQLPTDGLSAVMVPYETARDGSWRLRMQVFANDAHAKVVLRLLPERAPGMRRQLDSLGYSPSHMALWKQLTESPSFSAILAGATGSGKTTTLNVVMHMLPAGEVIYTIEDPVEMPVDHPNAYQIQVQRELLDEDGAGRAFGAAIAAILRGDVDTLMLGEIRDKASASAYNAIALAGHRSLATLHADGIHGILPRLTDRKLGLSRHELCGGGTLGLLCYQALPAMLCMECRVPAARHALPDDEVGSVVDFIAQTGLPLSRFWFRHPAGCAKCAGRGVVGQTVVAEMLAPDDEWLELVQQGKDRQALAHYRASSDRDWLSPDMTGKTVFEHAFFKAAQGQIDPCECKRLGGGFFKYRPLPETKVYQFPGGPRVG